MHEATGLHFRSENQRVKKPVVLSDPETGKKELDIELGEVNFQHFKKGAWIQEIDWEKGPGGGETGEISSIHSWGIVDEISSILYPLPGAVCFGLVEGKEEDDIYKGWDMVEIAHDLMGMVLVCVWKDGYGDVGLWIDRNLETFPDFFVGPLLFFLGFFPWFPPFEFPSVHHFFVGEKIWN